MDKKIGLMAIVIKDTDSVNQLNQILHDCSSGIIGRMGLPYRAKDVHIISIAFDAPQDVIDGVAAQISKLPGVSIQTIIA